MATVAVAAPTHALGQGSAVCGNGKVDTSTRGTCPPCVPGRQCPCADVVTPLEPCDGRDLGGKTCQTEGYFAGTLRCTRGCALDRSRCTKLASDLTLTHRTLGPGAPATSLAFSTNVLGVLRQARNRVTVEPYNFDFRGPWGDVAHLKGMRGAIAPLSTGWAVAAQRGTGTVITIARAPGGSLEPAHILPDERLVATAGGNGILVATEHEARTRLHRFDDRLQPVADRVLEIAGDAVQAAVRFGRGFAVAHSGPGGALRLRHVDRSLADIAAVDLPTPASFAITPAQAELAVVHADRTGTHARRFRLDGADDLRALPVRILSRPTRVVAAGAILRGVFAILQDGHAIRVAMLPDRGPPDPVVKTIVHRRGTKALGAATGYGRIFVAWSLGRKLHLSSFPVDFR
jgi:hypothetical protein